MFRLIMLLTLCSLFFTAGCGSGEKSSEPAANARQQEIILYSELDNKFTDDLVQAFNQKQQENKNQILLKAVYELQANGAQPDLVLAEQRTLNGLKLDGRLQSVAFAAGDRLPQKFRDDDLYWYGVFYDPAVFLINQQFSRIIGQRSLQGWTDLENAAQLRIAVENLSDSLSTQNFLGALADSMGETTSLNYLWNINRFIAQYAKFPFTPVRMAAVGDADLAITRQSYVFKYLENKFPAYVVIPKEGTPADLYGVAMFADCRQAVPALDFMEWLLAGEDVQKISQVDATGFLFLFPRGIDAPAADPAKIWLNRNYLTLAKQEALTKRWLERVRFSK